MLVHVSAVILQYARGCSTGTVALLALINHGYGTNIDITAFGLATPTEFQNVLATPDILRPLITSTGGGVYQLRQENRIRVPSIRQLPMGRAATGRGNVSRGIS